MQLLNARAVTPEAPDVAVEAHSVNFSNMTSPKAPKAIGAGVPLQFVDVHGVGMEVMKLHGNTRFRPGPAEVLGTKR